MISPMLTRPRGYIRFWVRRRGAVVTLGDALVAGTVVFLDGDVCHSVEGGVLDADPDLVRQGINAVADWFTMCWAIEHGARRRFMGSSHAWANNGPYGYKERWGALPVRRHGSIPGHSPPRLSPERCRALSEMGSWWSRGRHYRGFVAPGGLGPIPPRSCRGEARPKNAAGKGWRVLLLCPTAREVGGRAGAGSGRRAATERTAQQRPVGRRERTQPGSTASARNAPESPEWRQRSRRRARPGGRRAWGRLRRGRAGRLSEEEALHRMEGDLARAAAAVAVRGANMVYRQDWTWK